MNNFQNKKAFTLVELIVVVTILIVLSTISFVSYQNSLLDARNSVRISDMSNIKMALKNHKLKNWSYPLPWDPINITNSEIVIQQWFLNDKVATQELIKKPTDPLVTEKYYPYSITNNKMFFQVAMSLEDESTGNDYQMRAYVDWDYQQIKNDIPSLVFATDSSGSIQDLSNAFIVDKWTYNLPYDENGDIINSAISFEELISEWWISIPKFYWYYSCQEIYENGASMWSWTYEILQSNGKHTSTWCLMNY